jgi:hypothetical protein
MPPRRHDDDAARRAELDAAATEGADVVVVFEERRRWKPDEERGRPEAAFRRRAAFSVGLSDGSPKGTIRTLGRSPLRPQPSAAITIS